MTRVRKRRGRAWAYVCLCLFGPDEDERDNRPTGVNGDGTESDQ